MCLGLRSCTEKTTEHQPYVLFIVLYIYMLAIQRMLPCGTLMCMPHVDCLEKHKGASKLYVEASESCATMNMGSVHAVLVFGFWV